MLKRLYHLDFQKTELTKKKMVACEINLIFPQLVAGDVKVNRECQDSNE